MKLIQAQFQYQAEW